ncbi:MAG: tetratricopeptide repeat protein [Acidobacteriota bacterium]
MKSVPQSQIYEFGEFRIDATKNLLSRGEGETIPLTPKIFDTLLYLVRNSGHVIEKDELMREIWTDTIVEENNLNKNISVLRGVLGEKPGEHRFILTVPGRGYKFVADVKEVGNSNETATGEDANVLSNAPPTGHQDVRRKPNRYLLGVIALVVLAGLSLALFYWWRTNSNVGSDAPITTVAVLPFHSLVADERSEPLELGMADALISKLSDGEGIIVRPLESVRRSLSLEEDSLLVGRKLNADAVLDGSIQASGERIRISTRLLRTSDGKQLWAGQFDEKFTDIFAVQDSISQQVAGALKVRLAGKAKNRFTENVAAYQFYMKGRYLLLRANKPDPETSISYFQQAIDADPNYALAYAGLADAYRGRSVRGEVPSAESMPKAKAAALRAIELDDTLAEGHANLGHVMFWFDWDWDAAENQYKRALELDPNNADSLQFYAHLLSSSGRHAEALAKIKRARELDPLNLRVNAIEGMLLIYAGKPDEALATLQRTLELEPNHRLANIFAARAYIEKGMFIEAIAATEKLKENSPGVSGPVAYETYALVQSGNVADARSVLTELQTASTTRYVPPYNIALVQNALGEQEKALDFLEKAFDEKDVRIVFLKVEPRWNDLRSDPRFIDLMKRMNL